MPGLENMNNDTFPPPWLQLNQQNLSILNQLLITENMQDMASRGIRQIHGGSEAASHGG